MNRLRMIPWYLVGGFILGITLGLIYAWLISPVRYVDGAPNALRADFKDQYRELISSAYRSDGDLARASIRLALIGDADPVSALNGQASRLLEVGDPGGEAFALLTLAQALQPGLGSGGSDQSSPVPMTAPSQTGQPPDTMNTPFNPSLPSPNGTEITASQTPYASPTPRPTRTPKPTPGLPYVLETQEVVCDPNQLGALIQVHVQNSAKEPVPGVELTISWTGGREHIFTGLKPEMSDGYADFSMTPGILYNVQVAGSNSPVMNLEAPACESGGAVWDGSILLIFRQP